MFSASQLRRQGWGSRGYLGTAQGPNLELSLLLQGRADIRQRMSGTFTWSYFSLCLTPNRPAGGQFLSSDTCRLRMDGQPGRSWPWVRSSSANLWCECRASEEPLQSTQKQQSPKAQQNRSLHLSILTRSHSDTLRGWTPGLVLQKICYEYKTGHAQRVPSMDKGFQTPGSCASSASTADPYLDHHILNVMAIKDYSVS